MSGDLEVVSQLVQLSFLVQGTLARVADAHDLTTIQARLLTVLSDRAPTMRVLAGIMGLEKSSLTGLVERAEKRGFVERFSTEESRRSVRVRLTDEGRRRMTAFHTDALPEAVDLLDPLEVGERRQLSSLVERLIRAYVVTRNIDVSTVDLPSRFV